MQFYNSGHLEFPRRRAAILDFFITFKYYISLDQCTVFVTKDASSSLEENIYIRLHFSVYQLHKFYGLKNMFFGV